MKNVPSAPRFSESRLMSTKRHGRKKCNWAQDRSVVLPPADQKNETVYFSISLNFMEPLSTRCTEHRTQFWWLRRHSKNQSQKSYLKSNLMVDARRALRSTWLCLASNVGVPDLTMDDSVDFTLAPFSKLVALLTLLSIWVETNTKRRKVQKVCTA